MGAGFGSDRRFTRSGSKKSGSGTVDTTQSDNFNDVTRHYEFLSNRFVAQDFFNLIEGHIKLAFSVAGSDKSQSLRMSHIFDAYDALTLMKLYIQERETEVKDPNKTEDFFKMTEKLFFDCYNEISVTQEFKSAFDTYCNDSKKGREMLNALSPSNQSDRIHDICESSSMNVSWAKIQTGYHSCIVFFGPNGGTAFYISRDKKKNKMKMKIEPSSLQFNFMQDFKISKSTTKQELSTKIDAYLADLEANKTKWRKKLGL